MKTNSTVLIPSALFAFATLFSALVGAQQNILRPGDAIIASSTNSPASEGVTNAIDGKATKYLNFDTRSGGRPAGFVVTPASGRTVVTGMAVQSANDAPERDPANWALLGFNDAARPFKLPLELSASLEWKARTVALIGAILRDIANPS